MRFVIALLGGVLLVACGRSAADGGRSNDAGDGAIDTGDAREQPAATGCQAWAEAYCERTQTCDPFAFNISLGAPADCLRVMNLRCQELFDLPGVPDPTGAATACAETTRSAPCYVWYGRDACTLPPGLLADGAPCSSRAQCASTFCRLRDGLCGACAPVPRTGDTCRNQWECRGDAACRVDDTGGHASCVPNVGAGSPCGASGVCGLAVICGKDGICHPEAVTDEPCGKDVSCRSDLVCQDGRCRPAVFAKPGESCNSSTVHCSAGLCDSFGTGKCVALGKEGDECGAAKSAFCEAPYLCNEGRCQRFPTCQ
jgi:hypothetical protein